MKICIDSDSDDRADAPRMLRNLPIMYSRQKFHSTLVGNFVAFARERLAALRAQQER